jgi:hypothetical protein
MKSLEPPDEPREAGSAYCDHAVGVRSQRWARN